MPQEVSLESIEYTDQTGYATHVLVELFFKSGSDLRATSYELALASGKAELVRPGPRQVYSLAVQPIVAYSRAEREPIGAPLVHATSGGSFAKAAQVVTTGNQIARTMMLRVLEVPPILEGAQHRKSQNTLEVSFQGFTYHDIAEVGEAVAVDVTVWGQYEGEDGPWAFENVRVVDGAAELEDTELEDVTQLRFQPKRDDGGTLVDYGYEVVRTASPGYFLVHVAGRSRGTPAEPVNSAAVVQGQPVPQQGHGPTSFVAPARDELRPVGSSIKQAASDRPSGERPVPRRLRSTSGIAPSAGR